MQLKITTDYAIRFVLCLALHDNIVPSRKISTTMGFTMGYCMKIAKFLIKGGVIKEVRGMKGGYKLVKEPKDITLLSIIDAIEPTIRINRCLEEDKFCSRFATDSCPVRKFYVKMQENFIKELAGITVADLIGGC